MQEPDKSYRPVSSDASQRGKAWSWDATVPILFSCFCENPFGRAANESQICGP